MGVPTSEVSYTLATAGRGGNEVHKGHVVALEKKKKDISHSKKNSARYYHKFT
jgi:hypothetical protein